MKQRAETWLSQFGQFKHETKGFTLQVHRLNDRELINLKGVGADFLAFAPQMFTAVHPSEHRSLRKAIAYLHTLNALQAAAWQRVNGEFEAEAVAIREQLKTKRHGR